MQHNLSHHANQAGFKSLHHRWQRQDRQRQILRSQVGFGVPRATDPSVCHTCANYHGKFYGTSKERRAMLVCALHPFGWDANGQCPDWEPVTTECQPLRSQP